MSFTTIQIEKICRTCLAEEGIMRSVFSMDESVGETMRLFEMLMSCAAVQVLENDGLPSQVCLQCVHHISRAFSFKQLCERSDTTLRRLLEKPMQDTCLELKPLLSNDNAIEPDVHERIGATSDCIHRVSGGINNVVNVGSSTLDCATNETGDDVKIKVEVVDHDIGDVYEDDNDSETDEEVKSRGIEDDTEQPIYPCEECMQCFTTLAHAKSHPKKSRRICKICHQGFASSSTLCRHMKVHVGTKRHTCSECGKSFARSDYLKHHVRLHTELSESLGNDMKIHTGGRDHICSYCGKGFMQRNKLIVHKRKHTGERPYVCNECGKGYPDQARLTVHARSHNVEISYVCSECGRNCPSSSHLLLHSRIHTGEKPYLCNLCPKAFTRSASLRIHIKTHNSDRNHVCGICKKGFYQACTLKVHQRTHTGEKPYTCKICKKAFSQTGSLANHMKTHR